MIYQKYEKKIQEEANPLFDIDGVEYDNAHYRINDEFKQAIFKEYGIEDHPKGELIWAKSWEKGHSGGYSQIEIEFLDMLDLIK